MTYSTYSKAVILLAILAAAVSSVAVFNNRVEAQTSPSLQVNDVTCFQSIYELDDFYCGVVYELPTYVSALPITTPEAWCDELLNKDGCTGSLIEPDEPTSLQQNAVLIRVKQISTGALYAINTAPRVGFSIAGVYASAGHGITFGDSDLEVCVEANENIYLTSASSVCVSPVWSTAENNLEASRAALGQYFFGAVLSKGLAESRSLSYYQSGGLINSLGAIFVEEALPGATQLLPDTFTTFVNPIINATPTISATQLADVIATQNAGVSDAVGDVGESLFSSTPDGTKMGLTIGIAALAFLATIVITKNVIFASVGGIAGMVTFMPFDLIQMQAFFVLLSILAIMAAGFIVKKLLTR